ncbi:MAG: hypothetical protein JW829_05990, partial [Pirellulales bacterium]|nr:hypothetical protein [Pirellulales bacterium]
TFAPNPEELEVKPDADGRIRFNFHGQAWPDVLHWLAGVSGMSLDWQELPSDYLNLSTQRSYTLAEARDLINRHLLSRGFTLLAQGDVLMVANLTKLDPSLLIRVQPDELEDHPPYSYVKVSFDLPQGMEVEPTAEDVKSLLSPNGKVLALKATNRLLVLDSVANLRNVREVLYDEQDAAESYTLPKPFPLRYARATDVAETLRNLLGIQQKQTGPLTPQQIQMQQQQAQMEAQMRQQRQQQGKQPSPKKKEPEVYIVVDSRQNSLLVNAPPESMRIIEQAIKILDVPIERDEALAGSLVRVRAYRLVTLDPAVVVTTLEEVGDLDPQTRLKIDAKNRSIIAYATLTDHVTIQSVIGKLDGTGRQLEVIPLYRLRADEVAGTIQFLLVGEKEKKNDRYNDYYYYSPWESRRSKEDESQGEFRVDADIENNRLILWANDLELDEVRSLLDKLGERAGELGDPRTVRITEAMSIDQAQRLLGDLQQAWKRLQPNPMVIQAFPELDPVPAPDRDHSTPDSDGSSTPQTEDQPANQDEASASRTTLVRKPQIHFAQLTSDSQDPSEHASSETLGSQPTAPPVTVTVTGDGRLVFSCDDPAVLDRLEELYTQLASSAKDYEVFYLTNVKAYWVLLNLEEYFADELKDEDSRQIRDWYGNPVRIGQGDGTRRLSKRRRLKLISDVDTNSILAVNATPAQIATIRELIKIYDKKIDEDTISTRRTAVYQVRYSQASAIAGAIKEVYRDLLSSKDKAFQGGKGDPQQTSRSETYVRIYDSSDNPDKKKPAPLKAGFGGAVALGVDDVSNTIIVSAQEELMQSIEEMIRVLDEAARPTTTVGIHKLSPHMESAAVQKMLAETLNQPWYGNQRPDARQQKAPPPAKVIKPPQPKNASPPPSPGMD